MSSVDGKEPCDTCGRTHSSDIEILMRATDFRLEPIEILAQVEKTSHVFWPGVVKIDDDLVVKFKYGSRLVEAQSSEYARRHTSIPVPKVFLVFCDDGQTYSVTQLIKGITLHDCWDSLDDSQKVVMADKISSYVRQLQQISPAPLRPGPLDPTSPWYGRWFTDYGIDPPLQTYPALVAWLNHKADVMKRIRQVEVPPFTSDYPLVFTHGDIAPRNLIVDDDQQLWLIDWATAGWYPVYMEYASISIECNGIKSTAIEIEKWIEYVTRSLQRYDKELDMLKSIMWALQCAFLA